MPDFCALLFLEFRFICACVATMLHIGEGWSKQPAHAGESYN